jgi:hypothetical protein
LELEPIRVLIEVTAALERAGVEYAVGGSFASTFHGLPRTTNDIDIAVFLPEPRVAGACAALEVGFFVDEVAAREASRRRASFNVFHRETMLKIDFFVLVGTRYDREQMRRRVRVVVATDGATTAAMLAPEDVILRKLGWFRDGGGVSERQWLDVASVIKVQRERLDLAYLRTWATDLGVADLLERALVEAGVR